MRSVTKLLALLLLAAGLVGLAQPASQAAETWKKIDSHCTTVGAGKACVTTYTSSLHGARDVFTLAPASGKWMQATTYLGYTQASGSNDPVCSGGCAKVTKAWSHTVTCSPKCLNDVVDFHFTGSSGKASVTAGISDWYTWKRTCKAVAAGKVCVALADRMDRAVWQIRSTATFTPASGKWIEPIRVSSAEVNSKNTLSQTKTLCGCKKTGVAVGSVIVSVSAQTQRATTFKAMRGTTRFATSAGTSSYTVTYS